MGKYTQLWKSKGTSDARNIVKVEHAENTQQGRQEKQLTFKVKKLLSDI